MKMRQTQDLKKHNGVPLEVVDEEHDDQDLLGDVGLSPELVQEQARDDEGGRLLEEPSQLCVHWEN